MTPETAQTWALRLTEVERRIMPPFARHTARRRVWAYRRGLRSPMERPHAWQLAEAVGATTPYGVQHLLGRAQWEAAEVCKTFGRDVVEPRGDPQAVLVVDETGWLKQGQHAAGVARQ